ncbi:MAG: peptidylprolyl isomerase [Moraxella sp.]|nr:peptidylprolyl isomerase [Moraxella sp.]
MKLPFLLLIKALALTSVLANTSAFAQAISTTQATDGILAQVNDEIILKSEFIAASSALDAQYRAQRLNVSPEQLQAQVLDALIVRKLQLGIINKAGFSPDENTINRQLQQIAQSQGHSNLSELQKALDSKQQGSYSALRNQLIEDASLAALWQAQVAPRINISNHEIDTFLNSPEGAKIPSETVLVPQWQTSHILVRVDSQQSATIAQQKINALYRQLQEGADFKSLAATYSDDTGSASQNGSLGWVGEGEMVSEFETVMKNTQAGDFSAPFRSQFGWHILKVDNVRQHDVTTQTRRDIAKEILFERIAPQAEDDWIQELRAGAYINIFD